jgi:hypothetical protein
LRYAKPYTNIVLHFWIQKKTLLLIIVVIGNFILFKKNIKDLSYKTLANKKNMTVHSQYIVQFVGFKTNLAEIDFMQRWTPFAANFKRAGIKTIDLYKISDNDKLTFISRNIWDTETYFQHFPTGVAGSASGGGISVTQFGGYWIDENELDNPKIMQLLLTNESFSSISINRKRCTDKVNFESQIEFREKDSTLLKKNLTEILNCTHIKTL